MKKKASGQLVCSEARAQLRANFFVSVQVDQRHVRNMAFE
jgi:hypothetical protein